MKKKDKIEMNTDFLNLAYQFWNVAENSIEQMKKTGNKDLIIISGKHSMIESWSAAEEIFKWNANSIGIPILFNFYHGLELFMKGFMPNEKILKDRSHKLKSLYSYLASNQSAPTKVLENLKEILYNKDNNLFRFFEEDNSSVDNFYKLLKYPVNNDSNEINFHILKKTGFESYVETYSLIKVYINKLYDSLLEYNSNKTQIN